MHLVDGNYSPRAFSLISLKSGNSVCYFFLKRLEQKTLENTEATHESNREQLCQCEHHKSRCRMKSKETYMSLDCQRRFSEVLTDLEPPAHQGDPRSFEWGHRGPTKPAQEGTRGFRGASDGRDGNSQQISDQGPKAQV